MRQLAATTSNSSIPLQALQAKIQAPRPMQSGCRPATFLDLLDHGTVRKQILAENEILQTLT